MINIKAFYIQEDDKLNIINKTFNIIKVQNEKLILPVNLNENKTNKILKKIEKICNKYNVSNITISKNLQKNINLINTIKNYNLNMFDGKWLFKYMIYEVLEFVVKKTNQKKEDLQISILTNYLDTYMVNTIEILAKEFKKITIVTNVIEKFKKLEKDLYENYGVSIVVGNNKRKSLVKSNLILNYTFSKESLNKYNIYDNAIIINLKENTKIIKKRFNGITISNYEIKSKRQDWFDFDKVTNYFFKDIVETELYRKDNFINIRKDIKKYMLEIKQLYTNNGIL